MTPNIHSTPREPPGSALAAARTAADITLSRAAEFLSRHGSDPEVSRTYGYFTRHPVAPLNRRRLILLLTELSAIAAERGGPLRVLDVACGGGIIACSMAKLSHRVVGVDLSEAEIHLAQLFAHESDLGGAFCKTDLLQDPSWEKTVEQALGAKPDVVVAAYALHHLPQAEKFVDRLAHWLEPGARLLVNEENPDSPLFRLKHVVRGWIQRDTDIEWHRTYDGWKQLLEARGFRVSPASGVDLVPGLSSLKPSACWSLVFRADFRGSA